jgi:uncharacterized protein (DUF433 family)
MNQRMTTEETIIVSRCAEAIARLADAIRYPKVSRRDIEEALRLATLAQEAAAVIDPKEA